MKEKTDLSLASYTLGILSIVFAFFIPSAGLVLGIIGFLQSKKYDGEFSKKSKKFNKIGIILSIILLIVQIILAYYYTITELGTFPLA